MTKLDVVKEFHPDPMAPSQTRRFLRQALAPLAMTGSGSKVDDTVTVAANQLATNALLHGWRATGSRAGTRGRRTDRVGPDVSGSGPAHATWRPPCLCRKSLGTFRAAAAVVVRSLVVAGRATAVPGQRAGGGLR